MKPILFNTEMVRALLEGRKTVTRRVAFKGSDLRPFPRKIHPDGWWFRGRAYPVWDDAMKSPQGVMSLCRYRIGDILYVRETWAKLSDWTDIDSELGMPDTYIYRAEWEDGAEHPRWHPSIHMPKEAARLFLRVTDVRVELLQDINERGAKSAEHEGFVNDINLFDGGGASATRHFADLWDTTVKPTDRDCYGWAANPWVWVIEFEKIAKDDAVRGE